MHFLAHFACVYINSSGNLNLTPNGLNKVHCWSDNNQFIANEPRTVQSELFTKIRTATKNIGLCKSNTKTKKLRNYFNLCLVFFFIHQQNRKHYYIFMYSFHAYFKWNTFIHTRNIFSRIPMIEMKMKRKKKIQ